MIDEIDQKLREGRLRWNEYLVEIEDFSSLKTDLEKLFKRISSESDQYKLTLGQIKEQLAGLSQFLAIALDDPVVSACYKHQKTSFQKHREKVRTSEKRYTDIKNKFVAASEQIDTIR